VAALSDKVVAGVDFNGSKANPNETWLVVGRLSNLGLEIFDVKKTGSHVLAKDLVAHKTLSALGVDCPFSLPSDFLDFLAVKKVKKSYDSWQEVVEELVVIPFEEFTALAKEFGKESKRITDTANGSTVVSPLKRSNPPMQQLTFHGMRVLASLDPSRFFVLPFQDAIPFGCAVMEVYPPDTLKYLGLKETGYQSKDKGDETQAEAVREKLVLDLMKIKEKKALTLKDYPPLIIQKGLMHNFIKSEHAIDALIACYTTAMFTFAPTHFDDPFDADALEVLLEGWIYRAK
jgi:Protein of unknown function (DUF429)